MQLQELMDIADAAYPDGMVAAHWNRRAERPVPRSAGDTLAHFVIRELHDTYDATRTDADQLTSAVQVFRTAVRELECVILAFEKTLTLWETSL